MDEYNQNSNNNQGVDLFKLVTALSQKYDGKSQKGRKNRMLPFRNTLN